jgi:hypothetical protein
MTEVLRSKVNHPNSAAPSSRAKRRRGVSRRASSEARKSAKSIGDSRVLMPPGLRKSGMPDWVLMPAPVNTTQDERFRCQTAFR